MQIGSAFAARPTVVDRSRRLVPGLLLLGSALAFASALFSWFELGPRPVFSADHRLFAAAMGIVLLIVGIKAASGRVPAWAFAIGAAGCLALGGFAIYDAVTGHHRTFDASVALIARRIGPAVIELPEITARRLLAIGQARFTMGAGIWLASAAAVLGLIACTVGFLRGVARAKAIHAS